MLLWTNVLSPPWITCNIFIFKQWNCEQKIVYISKQRKPMDFLVEDSWLENLRKPGVA